MHSTFFSKIVNDFGLFDKWLYESYKFNKKNELRSKLLKRFTEKVPPVPANCFPLWASNTKKATEELLHRTRYCVHCIDIRVGPGFENIC